MVPWRQALASPPDMVQFAPVARSATLSLSRSAPRRCVLQRQDLPTDSFYERPTLFIEQGWQAKKVQAMMGHGSIQMTFDLYGHLWETAEDDAAAHGADRGAAFALRR